MKKSSICIVMPCYDSVKINTMLSIFQLIQLLGKGGVEVGINTMKSPLIHQARNYLTAVFLTTEYSHLLFIDADVEFAPEAVLRMMMAKKDIICTPYRAKNPDLNNHTYTVKFPDPKVIPILPGGLVEIEAGPTGLMLIDRKVFEKIIKNRPDLPGLALGGHVAPANGFIAHAGFIGDGELHVAGAGLWRPVHPPVHLPAGRASVLLAPSKAPGFA